MPTPFGSWKSPITAEMVAAAATGLAEVRLDGDDIYWIETRPHEGGRSVIVRRDAAGTTGDLTPPGFSAGVAFTSMEVEHIRSTTGRFSFRTCPMARSTTIDKERSLGH